MRVRLENIWEEVRSSYWFIPGVMAVAAILISFLTLHIDRTYTPTNVGESMLILGVGPDGARGLLSTVAGSMITVAGVTFSILIAAFAQASSQFGPRLLRTFMQDTGNQVVLGTFTATFIYSLMILRTIRIGEEDSEPFVPYISVTIVIPFAIFSIAVFIYFIHHAANSIQAPVVIADVANDLFNSIERIFPEEVGRRHEDQHRGEKIVVPLADQIQSEGLPVKAKSSGYLMAVDEDALLNLAVGNDIVIQLDYRPGHFVTIHNTLLKVWPDDHWDADLEAKALSAFMIGKTRTNTQDLEFAVVQLVEVAVRALSPGINDPFTAMSCLDWLGAALSQLAEKEFPTPNRYDEDGNLRVILTKPQTFKGITEAAFNQIRQNAEENTAVKIRMLEVILAISEHTQKREYLQALMSQADMIWQSTERDTLEGPDRRDIFERYTRVKKDMGLQ